MPLYARNPYTKFIDLPTEGHPVARGYPPIQKNPNKGIAFATLEIYYKRQQWDRSRQFALHLHLNDPADPDWLLCLMYSTRRAKSAEEAFELALEASRMFPDNPPIQYNLACYACLLGKRNLSIDRLLEAIRLDSAFIDRARNDDDLLALWDRLK